VLGSNGSIATAERKGGVFGDYRTFHLTAAFGKIIVTVARWIDVRQKWKTRRPFGFVKGYG
jgi:hypothetical protein